MSQSFRKQSPGRSDRSSNFPSTPSKYRSSAPSSAGSYLNPPRDSSSSSLHSLGNTKMNRSESIAYAQSHSGGPIGKLLHLMTQNVKATIATITFLGFVLFLTSGSLQPDGPHSSKGIGYLRKKSGIYEHFGGAIHPGYFSTDKSVAAPGVFRFAAVTDLDQLSRVADSKKPLFRSLLLPGTLTYTESSNTYKVELEQPRTLTSAHNEAGRGMELSELTVYNDRLLTFDDRTGTVFEILSSDQGKNSYVVPRFVVTEGDGDTDKGMKWEWASVKDNKLYMGSMGKEYTNPDGSVANTNNLWIAILSQTGELSREDWTDKYNFVRSALGASYPGYMINEAILWSPHLKKWCFLPRRVSSEQYDENMDEKKGSNKLVLVDENFTETKVVDIKMKDVDPLHGFSTFAFIPGTNDRHAAAIRSVEEDCVGGEEDVCKQRSYMIVFDVLTGDVLMDEIRIDAEMGVKYEGIEFVDIYTPEPTY